VHRAVKMEAKRLIKEFPNKRWSVASINRLIKKMTTAGQVNGSQAVLLLYKRTEYSRTAYSNIHKKQFRKKQQNALDTLQT